jgi:hypothetical protein
MDDLSNETIAKLFYQQIRDLTLKTAYQKR